jgi:hypothetical protein
MGTRIVEQFTEGSLKFSVGGTGAEFTIDPSCQVTRVRLTATSATTTVPGVLCDPTEADVPQPSKYALEIGYLQDNTDPEGLSAFLWEHDAERGSFEVLTAGANPRLAGECFFIAGDYGADAGKPMDDTKTLPVLGKPERSFGAGELLPLAIDVTEGAPGTFAGTTGAAPTHRPPSTKAELDTITPSVPAAWTTGSYVVVAGSEYNWDAAAWANGRAVFAAGADNGDDGAE